MNRIVVVLLLGCFLGCEGKPPPREIAQPIEAGPVSEAGPSVRAEKPAQSDPAATTLVNAILMAHTNSQPSLVERLRKVRMQRAGEWQIPGQGTTRATMSIHIWGERYRTTYTLEAQGNLPNTFSVNGNSGWYLNQLTGGQPAPLDPTTEEMVLPDVRADRMTLLFPLANPNLIATMAREGKAGAEAIVRVWIDDQPPILIHTDSQTNRIARLTYETMEGGQAAVRSLSFRELAPVAGVLLPSRLEFGSGRVTMTNWTKIDYEVPAPFELSIFDKP